MTAARASAVHKALALLQAPASVAEVRARALPEEMTRLLRIVSGDGSITLLATQETHEPAEVLQEAAEFFVLQVCFTPGIDSYRVLGVDPLASTPRIREHYRLLVRWLHPDRNPDAWQSGFLDRVNQAWRDLRDTESRARYDQHRAMEALGEMPATAPVMTGSGAPNWGASASGSRLSARTMRWLPGVVLTLMGMVATLVLVLMYVDHVEDQRAALALETLNDAARESQSTLPSLRRDRSSSAAAATDAPVLLATAAPPSLPMETTEARPDTASAATPDLPAPEIAADTQSNAVTSAAVVAKPEAGAVPVAKVPASSVEALPAATPQAAGLAVADVAQVVDTPEAVADAQPESVFDNAESTPLLAGAAANQPAAAAANSIEEPVVNALLQNYRDAYDAGDLVRLMALFTRDARNLPEGSRYLVETYRQLFETSRSRRLSLKNMSWWQEGDAVAVVASFDAAITPVGRQRPRRFGGDIRFDLRREDGEVRIQRVRHQTQ